MVTASSVTLKRCTCQFCGTEFEASRRASYCSAACKQSAYRSRNNQAVTFRSELTVLVEKYQHILRGREGWIDCIADSRYRRRSLHESVVSSKYRDLRYQLTGHETNDLAKGIFAHLHEQDIEALALMILMELLEGIERPCGGSVHQCMGASSHELET